MTKRLLALVLIFYMTASPALAMTTPVFLFQPPASNLLNTVTRYFGCGIGGNGGSTGDSTNQRATPMPIAGTFSKLYLRFPAALTGAQTWTVTIIKNGVDTALTATITSSGILSSDTTHSATFAAGDLCAFKLVPSGTPTVQSDPNKPQVSVVFDGSTEGESYIAGTGTGADTTVQSWVNIGGYNTYGTTEANVSGVFPTGGVIDKLYVNLSTAPTAGKSYAYELYKNGAATGLTCTVSDTATTCNDTTHTVTMAAGDRYSMSATPSGTPAANQMMYGMRFTPTVNGESVVGVFATSLSGGNQRFFGLSGTASGGSATEDVNLAYAPIALTLKKLYIDLNVAPGSGKSRGTVGRINSATSTLSVTISNTATTGNDTTHSDSVAIGDLINWSTQPTGAPTAPGTYRAGAVIYIAPAVGGVAASIVSSKFGIFRGRFTLNGGKIQLK